MKKYEVHWKDHFSATGWQEPDAVKQWAKRQKKKRCSTIGYIAYEDKEILVMANSHDGRDCYGDFMAIYKNHITKKRRVR